MPENGRRLRVAIDARVMPDASGGVATFVRSLVSALGQLTDGDERYIVAVRPGQREWIESCLGRNQELRFHDPLQSTRSPGWAHPLRRLARYVTRVMDPREWPEVPLSDGFFEGLGSDILHIPRHAFTVCALPTIYNPHDLQHLHHPQFWDVNAIAWRERVYRTGCQLAHAVTVGSQWIKEDVVRQYGVPADKVQVIPEAAWTESYTSPGPEVVERTRVRYGLDDAFLLYPAVTWPHKNHIALLEALARLRDERGLVVQLVCTGSRHAAFWPQIQARVDELRLGGQVKFLGFVPEEDLKAMYRLATVLIMPTLFEAISLPIFEAWAEGLPVACANVTALPEQVRDAGCLFDPRDAGSIAESIATLMGNAELREDLRSRGYRRSKRFDWARTARAYRAVYRRTAGRPLTEEDRWLLERNWLDED